MNKNIIILGPPGSGKGTQAKDVAKKFGYIYFGTGDLMREEASKDTEFGKIFQAVWDKGDGGLVDNKIVNDFVATKIKEMGVKKTFVFDGMPRTLAQVKLLEDIFGKEKEKFIVININVTDENLIERMQTRRVCGSCSKIFFRPADNNITKCDKCGGQLLQRQEDQPEVIRKRLAVYKEETQPVIDYYAKKGNLVNINGEPPIEVVKAEINEKLK